MRPDAARWSTTLLVLIASASTAGAQTVGGVVFLDRNANRVRDAGEPGVPNVAVSDQDTVVLTGADGSYRLHAGRGHGIVFVSVPSGYTSTGAFWRSAREPRDFGLAEIVQRRTRGATFTFIHASDTHISEQSASRTRRLREMADSIGAAFVLISGDLVRDALRVPEAEARGYYDLFVREKTLFSAPVFTAPGNHEIFGIETDKSGVAPTHPLFGKTMYRSYLGPDYYSFNHGGIHFVALNTVDVYEKWYHGNVDSLQLAWLERDLAAIPAGTPVVTFNHIPFYATSEIRNGYDDKSVAPTLITVRGRTQFRHSVANATEVLKALAKRRHVLALGGHIHARERIEFEREGERTRFENGAAVIGPTSSTGRVFSSGFTVYGVRDGVIDEGRFVRLP
jgi:Icc protein